MVLRWTRKALVLSLAVLGVQYARFITRVLFAEMRPERRRLVPIPDGPLLVRGTARAPQRVVTTTLEAHGAL